MCEKRECEFDMFFGERKIERTGIKVILGSFLSICPSKNSPLWCEVKTKTLLKQFSHPLNYETLKISQFLKSN
jgi:hypothetical protein